MKLPIRKKALIQTERLTLKPYEVKDVEALADLLMNQEIGKTFMVPDFQTQDQAIALAEKTGSIQLYRRYHTFGIRYLFRRSVHRICERLRY